MNSKTVHYVIVQWLKYDRRYFLPDFSPFCLVDTKKCFNPPPTVFSNIIIKNDMAKTTLISLLKEKIQTSILNLMAKKWSSWFELSEQSESRLIIKESMSPSLVPRLDLTQTRLRLHLNGGLSEVRSQVKSSQVKLDDWSKNPRLVETPFVL